MPLNDYKQYLKAIAQHPSVAAHNPRLILITPPPINEYKLEESDLVKGLTDPRRTAEHTKKYADACREVAKELGVAVLDIWSIMMAKAGWREGQPLPGSKDVERNEVLEGMLIDGEQTTQALCMLIILIVVQACIFCQQRTRSYTIL